MAIANLSPTTRVWLERDNFSQVLHSTSTGRIGLWTRAFATGYTDETVLLFDLSSLAGATVTSVDLDITCNSQGSQTGSETASVLEQDDLAPGSWSSPPEFDDFTVAPWTNSLSTQTVQNTGSYNFATSAGFVSLVQSWIDDSNDNWGIIVQVNFGALGWYLSLDDATLNVTYTTEDNTKIAFTTPGFSTFNVPAGVTFLTVKSWGAGAGGAGGGTSGVGGSGGGGGYVQGIFAVTPGEQLTVHVGGKGELGAYPGSNSGSGGGGAGRSLVSRGNVALAIAGGGGGGGGGDNSSSTAGGAGGAGGDNTGGSGGNSSSSIGAGGGTQTDGGAGGTGGANVGEKGQAPAAFELDNCLNFDGDPESVNLGNDSVFNFTNSFTLEAWVKFDVVNVAQRFIGSRSDDTLHGVGFGVNGSGNILFTTFGHDDFTSTGSVSAGVWTHLAIVMTSANNGRFYKNGVFVDQINKTNAATTTGIDMHIAQMGDDAQYFSGEMDEVRMWSDERTDAEVLQYYAQEVSSGSANLVGYWKMNEGTGSTTVDETVNANTGTLLNMEADDWLVPSDWAPPSIAGAGGDGADGETGTGKGSQDNGGITNGGAGGTGNITIGYGGGGGGGSGYGGGGGGASSVASNAGGSGGGGGSNYIDSGATSTTNSQASGVNPPNTGDDDYVASLGVGGAGGATSTNGVDGNDGRIVFLWSGATYHYGMQFFSSSNEYLSSVSTFTPPANGSVAFWMYLYTHPGVSIMRVLGFADAWEIELGTAAAGKITNGLNASGTALNSATTLEAYKRYHIVCTYDSSNNGRILIDGVLDNTGTAQTGSPGTGTLALGYRTGATGEYFYGLLEDIRVYSRVLSDAECLTIYSSKGTDGIKYGLLNRWLLNEGPMETTATGVGLIKDLGIDSINMTPNNTPTFKGTQLKTRRFI